MDRSSRRLLCSVLITAPGALGTVVRSEESPDGGGSVKSIARNSHVSANVSKLQAMVSRQYSRIFRTPYLHVNRNKKCFVVTTARPKLIMKSVLSINSYKSSDIEDFKLVSNSLSNLLIQFCPMGKFPCSIFSMEDDKSLL